MGTDIHVVAQVRGPDGTWRDLPTDGYDIESRNYTWFTFLCGQRSKTTNGDRGLGITPIDEYRGAPPDFETVEDGDPWCPDVRHGEKWMGYGVASWVTLAEIQEHASRQPKLEWPVGPIDELERLFAGHSPADCRIVFGFDS